MLPTGHVGAVNAVAWSADGRTLMTAGADGQTLGWLPDLTEVLELAYWELPETPGEAPPARTTFLGVALSADGDEALTLAQPARGGETWLSLWDSDAMAPISEQQAPAGTDLLAWSPRADQVLTGRRGSCAEAAHAVVRVGEIGPLLPVTLPGCTALLGVGWTDAGGRLLYQTGEGLVLADETGQIREQLPARAVTAVAFWGDTMSLLSDNSLPRGVGKNLAYAPDGRALFALDVSGGLWTWAAPAEKPRLLRRSEGDTSRAALSLAISPDGATVALGCADGAVRLIDARTGAQRHAVEPVDRRVSAIALSEAATEMMTVRPGGRLHLWTTDGAPHVRVVETGLDDLSRASLAADGERATVLTDNALYAWQLDDGAALGPWPIDRATIAADPLVQRGPQPARFDTLASTVLWRNGDQIELWASRVGEDDSANPLDGYPSSVLDAPITAIEADASRVVLGDAAGRVWRIDRPTGAIRGWTVLNGTAITAIALRDTAVAVGGQDGRIAWLLTSGAPVVEQDPPHRGAVRALAWGGAGSLLSGGDDGRVLRWSGPGQARRVASLHRPVVAVDLSADEQTFAAVGQNGRVLVRGPGLTRSWRASDRPEAVKLSPRGLAVALRGPSRWTLQQLVLGERHKRGDRTTGPGMWVWMEPKGASWRPDSENTVDAGEWRRPEPEGEPGPSAAFQVRAGDTTVYVPMSQGIVVWDAPAGRVREVFWYDPADPAPQRLVVSEGDAAPTIAVRGQHTSFVDVRTGRQLARRAAGPADPARGEWHFSVDADRSIREQDAEFCAQTLASMDELGCTGRRPAAVRHVAWAPRSGALLLVDDPGITTVWDADRLGTGPRLAWGGNPTGVSALAVARSRALTADATGFVRVWDLDTGARLGALASDLEGGWAVTSAEGRYDAINGGDFDGVYWVYRREPIALKQLKSQLYTPYLLLHLLGAAVEPMPPVTPLRNLKLFPEVQARLDGTTLHVALQARDGGLGSVRVEINGRQVIADARQGDGPLAIDLRTYARFLAPGDNTVGVSAANADESLRSRTTTLPLRWGARGLDADVEDVVAPSAPAQLWAVVAGAADYADDSLDLSFSHKDAMAMATALRLAGEGLGGPDRAHVTLVERADRAPILAALAAVAAQAAVGDKVVVYLAGHGVAVSDEYYFLTETTRRADTTDAAGLARVAISGSELATALAAIPAAEQLLILDTCHAGAVAGAAWRNPAAQVRSLDRVKDTAAVMVLAGSAADAVSYESSALGQGLLTYSLLSWLAEGALAEGRFVDAGQWFTFVADRVPALAREIRGVQRPVIAIPNGAGNIRVGELDAAGRAAIPLATVRPRVVRSVLVDADLWADTLGLGPRLDQALRASADGPDPRWTFADSPAAPEAWTVVGRYTQHNGIVALEVRFIHQGKVVDTVRVQGPADDLEALIAPVTSALAARLRQR